MNVNTLLSAMIAQLQAQKVSDTSVNNTTSATSSSQVDFASYLNAAQSGSTTLEDIFNEASKTYDVDVNLLKAIGKAESGFQVNATSYVGAQGIMQLMPSTAEYLGVEDAYDAKQNIFGGAKYISQLLKQYDGDVSLALAAYNAGSGNVAKYGGIPPFAETQNYVQKVLGYYEEGVTIPTDKNIVLAQGGQSATASVNDTSDTTNLLQQLQYALQELQNSNSVQNILNEVNATNSLTSEETDTVAIWNTEELGTTVDSTKSEALLEQLQELLLAMNEEDSEFSYEDYGRFLTLYLDRVSLTTFQNAVKGGDTSVPDELEEALEEFQAEMNGEDTTENQDMDSMYSFQSINYNPTVLKLLSTDEA